MAHSDIEQQALDACEDEPIRTPARIQQHGFMCVCDLQFSSITHVSQNAKEFIGRSAADTLGRPPSAVFDRIFCHALRNAASLRTIDAQREYLGSYDLGAGDVEAACHRRGSHFIIELTRCESSELDLDINRMRWLFPRWGVDAHVLEDALDILVHDLRTLTKFNRVMAYRFLPDGSGEVIAESLAPNTESYRGLRFPKWDVPQSARAISLEQPLRFIGDTAADEIPLLSVDDHAEAVDMTLSELRGTSPVHKEYLTNMGVRSSLVVPVVIEGALWGMFSLHHVAPQKFTIRETLSIELVGQMLTTYIASVIAKNFQRNTERLADFVPKIFGGQSASSESPISKDGWEYVAGELCALLSLDGVILEWGSDLFVYGRVPVRHVKFLAPKLQPVNESISLTDQLEDKKIAGAMCIKVGGNGQPTLWLFRQEERQTIKWAGAPKKEIDATSSRLRPRGSFLAHVEESKGKSRAWEPEKLEMALALQTILIGEVERDTQRRENMEMIAALSSMHHLQTQRLLSFMQSLIYLEKGIDYNNIDDHVKRLEMRVREVTEAYKTVVVDHEGHLPIRACLTAVFKGLKADKILYSGPDLILKIDTAIILMFSLKEVANYSASVSGYDAEWSVDDEFLNLRLFGYGASDTQEPSIDGSFAISNIIQDHLNGKIRMNKVSEGIEVLVSLPKFAIVDEQNEYNEILPISDATDENYSSSQKTILILEDNYLIGVSMRSMIRSMGSVNVLLALDNSAAQRELNEKEIDFAVLDIRLKQESCEATAKALEAAGVDFVFVTGFEDPDEWLAQFATVPVLRKPLQIKELSNYVMPILSGRKVNEPLTILLVEDNIPLQEQLSQEILELGHRVERASTVQEAETILDSVEIDAIILDIFIDIGNEFAKEGTLRIVSRIRHEMNNNYRVEKDVAILAISGALEVPGGFSPLKMASQIGVNDCMAKPLDLDKLREWIGNVEKTRSDRENVRK